jgi:GTP-binding protein
MIPVDTNDIKKEYEILLNELRKYNPELLDKKRLLAISKCDMLDDELLKEVKKDLPKGIPSVFISSLTNQGITDLKDLIWRTLNP